MRLLSSKQKMRALLPTAKWTVHSWTNEESKSISAIPLLNFGINTDESNSQRKHKISSFNSRQNQNLLIVNHHRSEISKKTESIGMIDDQKDQTIIVMIETSEDSDTRHLRTITVVVGPEVLTDGETEIIIAVNMTNITHTIITVTTQETITRTDKGDMIS